MRRSAAPLLALALLALPGLAAAAPPLKALGHVCKPQDAVRFCPTRNDAQRVKSFDGLPLDADVTLPPVGAGPFPTIIMLHGFGAQDKTYWQSTTPDGAPRAAKYHFNDNYFAKHGYAVITYSARGFGRSCGKGAESTPGCAKGWFHFADQRWEVHDAQTLLGKLVDDGIADPGRLGATGESYGGITSVQLAYLRNRIRRIDGKFAPWKSPNGRKLSLAAAWERWAPSDLSYSLVPNGRFLSNRISSGLYPFGIPKQSIFEGLYLGGLAVAHASPKGADPTADITTWHDKVLAGDPPKRGLKAIYEQTQEFKSPVGIPGRPSPLLVQNGWTDPVFPVEEALRTYNRSRAGAKHPPLALQLGDIGHFTGGEALADYVRFNDDGAAFFAHYLKGQPGGPKPLSVTVFGQGCPKGSAGFGPITATRYSKLAHGSFRLGLAGPVKVTSTGGDPDAATLADPASNTDRCAQIDTDHAKGVAVLKRKSKGFRQLGLPTVHATIKTDGHYGQLDARLWDVSAGKQRLVDWGVYRLAKKQRGHITFQLFGNAYPFAKGHTVKLELLGRNASALLASNEKFDVRVADVRLAIPTRDAPSAARGISKPTRLR
ncbi:MAG: type transport system ATP-binding protein [Thermoleophilaceae bacterium]|nr:type transport system ATP-binding protein [Thermoleophilaceae bacterium]